LRHITLNHRAIAYFLGGVTTIKLAMLLLVGPVIWPDTGGYISFADALLHGQVFDHVGFASGPAAPILVFRLAGYPIILAAIKLISLPYYGQITVVLQILINTLTMVIMVRVLAGLSFTTPQIVFAIGLYAFSDSLLFDNSLLSDSIYSSFFNIVIFVLLGHLVAGSRLTLVGASALGLLWGFSTWMRDSGIYLTYLPVGLLIAIALRAPASNLRRFGHLFTFIIVIFAMTGAYSGFNKYRTGEFFFSITGVENWLHPVFDMAKYGYADPFNEDDLVSQTVREGIPNYEYPAQLALVEKLHQRCGCTPRQLQSLLFQKYLTTVTHHPIGYIGVVWRNFHFFGLVGLLADPIATINQFFEFATSLPHKFAPGLSIRNLLDLRQQFSVVTLLLMLLNALSTAVATVLFSLFLFGIPFMMVCALRRRAPIPLSLAIVGFLWFAFASVSIAFSLVHYEARYALPVLPAGCIGIVYATLETSRLLSRPAARSPPS
jgi:hypothetical protein